MSFTDIIKNSVLARFNAGDLSVMTIVMTLAMAAAMGVFVYVVYRLTTKGSFYNRDFNKTLAILPPITAGIMLAMQSNLVISLGMVGALSIVRFRNAVKNAGDLMYLFWSISLGIVVGANLMGLALLMSLCITVMILGLDLLPAFRMPCLLVVSGERDMDETALMNCVRQCGSRMKVRSRCVTKKGMEWILEVSVRDEKALVDQVAEIPGVVSLNLMSHDGQIRC